MRRLHSWPAWVLRAVIRYRVPAGLVADAWIELVTRANEEANAAAGDAANDETGPYLVSPPEGMH